MSDRITVVGNIATTPERRRTASGVTVISFRLATNHRRRDANGQWVDSATNWYTVSGYRGLAEHALSSFVKGERVIVTGSLRVRDWESNGKHGREAEIDADAFGHDLLWGTTVFARDVADGAAAEQNGNGYRHNGNDGYRQNNPGQFPNGNGHGHYQTGNDSHGAATLAPAAGAEGGFPPPASQPSPPTEAADWGAPRDPADSDTPF